MPLKNKSSGQTVAPAPAKRQKLASAVNSSRGSSIVIAPQHAVAYDGHRQYAAVTMAPAPATNALSVCSPITFVVEKGSAGALHDCVLRFTVTCATAAMKSLPVPLWFDRIEWWDREHYKIATYHGDFLWWVLQSLPRAQLQLLQGPCNFNAETGGLSDFAQTTGDGGKTYYYLPLPYTWLENQGLDLHLLRGDLEIRLYPKGNIVQSTTSTAVPSIEEIRWISGSEKFSAPGLRIHKALKAGAVHQHNFLSVQKTTVIGKTMAAGSSYDFNLDAFHHDSAMLLCCIRPNGWATEQAINYVSLGPRGTIDFVDTQGAPVYSNGRPIDETYMRTFISSQVLPHKYAANNAVYVVPFTKNTRAAWRGVVDGWYALRGDKVQLQLVTDQASTSGTGTLTLAAVAGSDETYQLGYKGEWTDVLADDTTTANMAIAINALSTVQADNLKFSFATTLAASATCVITITDRAGNAIYIGPDATGPCKYSIDFRRQTTTPAAGDQEYDMQVTTKAILGFQGGSGGASYDIDIYSVFYRHVQEQNGNLRASDL